MSTQFQYFNQYRDLFESQRDKIIHDWVHESDVEPILKRHDIAVEVFAEKFAYAVFDYFIQVAKGESQIGDCPVMSAFLQFLRDKEITASELFVICSKFRKSMLNVLFDQDIVSYELHNEIGTIFDKNFAGVLVTFGNTIKKAESALEKSEQLLENYKKAIDAHSIVSITDPYGVITYVNDAFCKISGYSREELLGKNHSIIRHEDMSGSFFKAMWDQIRSGKVFHDVIKNKSKNGAAYFADSVIVPLLEPDGSISGYMSVRHDITDNIASMENAVAAEELALEAKEIAEAAEKSKDDFLAAMSHEIRTPLNAILGFVSLLQKSKLPQKESGYLEIVNNSGQSLLTIINDILDFAKIRSGKFEIDPFECDPSIEIENALELFTSKMSEKGIEFLPFIDPMMPLIVKMDAVRVRQIISNFLSNAVKFTPEEGLVHFRAFYDKEKQRLSLYVQDSGIGIKRENLDKVFGAFSQEESSTSRKYGGTGLGLSICKSLAEIMDGEVGVDSIEGKGSTFFLHIPIEIVEERTLPELEKELIILSPTINAHQYKLLYKYCQALGISVKDSKQFCDKETKLPIIGMSNYIVNLDIGEECFEDNNFILLDHIHNDYDERRSNMQRMFFPLTPNKLISALQKNKVEEEDQINETAGFSGHILVAEDNITNQQLISILLDERGLSFDMVANGEEAVEAVKNNHYDLILMDNNMPVMGGIEATEKIHDYINQRKGRKIPIVALTANASNADKAKLLASGMDDYLSKPIDINELDRVFMSFLPTAGKALAQ